MDELLSGSAEDAAAAALADPPLLGDLLEAMRSHDPGVRARAADAAERVVRERAELLAPRADALIEIAAQAQDRSLRLPIAQMLARVELSDERAQQATDALASYLEDDENASVQAWALSAIVAIANDHPALREHAAQLVHERAESDAEPLRERARMLLAQAEAWPS